MEKSITEIKKEFKEASLNELAEIIDKYSDDGRKGVLDAVKSARTKLKKLEYERIRLFNMTDFERKYKDYSLICGIDEVGRGPLAGPVVAAAVILPKDCEILYLNDSKKLSEKKREELYDEICEKAVCYGIGCVSHERIDEINILNATKEAMKMAVADMKEKPDLLLIDAVTLPDMPVKQVSIIKGDAKSVSIAAASVLAKVTRDRMMAVYDDIYPEYGFASNKGYGSEMHINAIKKYGPTEIHRKTFIKNFV